jgi:hypothetical protein
MIPLTLASFLTTCEFMTDIEATLGASHYYHGSPRSILPAGTEVAKGFVTADELLSYKRPYEGVIFQARLS